MRTSLTEEPIEEHLQGPTTNLALINVVFYVITVIVGRDLFLTGDLAIVLFGFSLHNFFAGLFWTPLTAIITHGSIAHLGGNMVFLLIFGFKLEERGYNAKGIYLAYLVTGILSTILGAPLIGATTISVGASGSIFGFVGLNAGIERREGGANYKAVVFASFFMFILSTSPNTNIFAHFIGLVIGFIIGALPSFARFKTEINETKRDGRRR